MGFRYTPVWAQVNTLYPEFSQGGRSVGKISTRRSRYPSFPREQVHVFYCRCMCGVCGGRSCCVVWCVSMVHVCVHVHSYGVPVYVRVRTCTCVFVRAFDFVFAFVYVYLCL